MKPLSRLVFISLLLLAGCSSEERGGSDAAGGVGSDRDEHGCIPSAGYAWCARTNRCERPWELAEQAGFENSASGFESYCEG